MPSNVIAQGGSAFRAPGARARRNVSGNLEGRGGDGNFQVIASAPGFTANISLTTQGNKQSVVIKSDSVFRVASISLTRS